MHLHPSRKPTLTPRPESTNIRRPRWTGAAFLSSRTRTTVPTTPQARRPRVMSILPHVGGVSLRALLHDDLSVRPPDVRTTSCTHDFRRVRPGDVYVALAEAETDGHDFAAEAARRGAAALICERTLPVFNVPQFVVGDSRAAYGRLCQALVGNPSHQLKVIGVTGTNGKTSVARLMSSIFKTAGNRAGLIDSIGAFDGADCRSAQDVELSAPGLARTLARMEASGLSRAI